MAQFLPMTLLGHNLGHRHRYFNSQVDQAAQNLSSFQDIRNVAESSALDRLFKIDLAIKLENIDYLLMNLKDDDMLYVSRALKCKWLVSRRDIINPKYLEDMLFPEMIMPAISKMKHWLYINLRDPFMCQEFYQYYKDTQFDYAIKFLRHSDNKFVLAEFPKILTKITPHYLKVFGEKNHEMVKIYFDALATDNEVAKCYMKKEQKFYRNIRCLLKLHPDTVLDITEKYHDLKSSKKFSPSATEYIMRFQKSRFTSKPELYVAYILHVPTVAKCLNIEECKDIVLKLARADYLSSWFSYVNVEPLVKRVSDNERAAFKKLVFVQKDVGEHITKCPYALPASPVVTDFSSDNPNVFQDRQYSPIEIWDSDFRTMLKKRKCAKWCNINSKNTELQKLFDEFRYMGFEKTLYELKKRISAAASADRRRDMMLVLVSKSGGRPEAVRALLQEALQLRNEPVHERAAIVRSLVKRASAWRLPQDIWNTIMEYAYGLGLDGTTPEATCREGLHAVVIRQLIATGECEPTIRAAFMKDFSTLAEYKLMASERAKISAGLEQMLVKHAVDADPKDAASYLGCLLDVLAKYHISIESSSAISAIAALAKRDSKVANSLLVRLYNARVGRRELFLQNLAFRIDDASLSNVLRHDPDAITAEKVVDLLLTCPRRRIDRFHLKVAVYFNETGGIAEQMRHLLWEKIIQKPDKILARPLATLAGKEANVFWNDLDERGGKYCKIAAAIRANMHRARPAPDALALGWRKAGMMAVARHAMRCRPAQLKELVQTLLMEREKRTVRLALALAQRTDCAADMFSMAVNIRPLATLRAALLYYHKLGEAADPSIWDIVKHLLSSADLNRCKGLTHILKNIKNIPNVIKPDYCAILYLALSKTSDGQANDVYRDLMHCLPRISEDLLESVVLRMMEDINTKEPVTYPAMIIRYLMLSKTNDDLNTRFEKVGKKFLDNINTYTNVDNSDDDKQCFRKIYFRENLQNILNEIMTSLQYNVAFFDIKYECCVSVIERVLTWIQNFMPREVFFEDNVKIDSTILYYKAVRHSIEQNPEIFDDAVKKISDGVNIVGFTFGGYVVKEVAELKSKYFDSIIELYRKGFTSYLCEYIPNVNGRDDFIAAVLKGILAEGSGSEVRLAVHTLDCLSCMSKHRQDIKEILMKHNDKETHFFMFI